MRNVTNPLEDKIRIKIHNEARNLCYSSYKVFKAFSDVIQIPMERLEFLVYMQVKQTLKNDIEF